ncbi:hypothetical protein DUNSADRAFT_1443 [Dunaliella salina]|uniref:Xrn1 helical domain-containing protein n=1 Tax=Dunaliella salina TaxID=3046 RepID=A0ABQ7FXF2_DUNSA|nr:hypothetical protein DUNSADRAFT_1443 [Dunaliella salina]|eukprot:KAF5827041.1 hypothetical protein DUNSADRAFT_1443 [Dunaliella salina]
MLFHAYYCRERYYDLRFKANGNIDKVAKQVARDFIDGMAWVYRYYSFGPATVLFHDDVHAANTAKMQGSAAGQAGVPEGASWTWTYPHHYAPLIW